MNLTLEADILAADGSIVPSGPAEYRRIPGFNGYAAGSDGSIWSCRPRRAKSADWRRLRPGIRQGYCLVALAKDGKSRTNSVHRLVMLAFIGPAPVGLETRHLDGNPANNALSNLEYGTKSQNTFDAIRHGKHPCLRVGGEGNPKAKLTVADVIAIRELASRGFTPAEIVKTKQFPVSPSTIQRVVSGKLWSNDAAMLCQRIKREAKGAIRD